MTTLDRDEIIAMRKDGRSWQQIADHYGMSRRKLGRQVAGMNLGSAARPLRAPLDLERLAEMVEAGYSDGRIAEELGANIGTVQRRRLGMGVRRIPEGSRRTYPPEIWEPVEKMLDEGMSYNAIATALGVDHRAISKRFPGRGWTYKQGGEARAMEMWGMKKVDRTWKGVAS